IGMYSWQAQIYLRTSSFPYDGIRLTTDGVLELYRDYGGDYGTITHRFLVNQAGVKYRAVMLVAEAFQPKLYITTSGSPCVSFEADKEQVTFPGNIVEGSCNTTLGSYKLPGRFHQSLSQVAIGRSSIIIHPALKCEHPNVRPTPGYKTTYSVAYSDGNACYGVDSRISNIGVNSDSNIGNACVYDTPCVFGLLGGARFDWDFYVDGFKVEEFINGPFDDPLSCFFYIEQNIP
ncbi:uncharacterized protein LOC142356182, partial [Convolutriloba macropyga]|uniref:uncharacterized protein LOC142356182 n=1 Tax=Convolutriloba macropyga TaxID=536237 RepID=UPI003F51FF8B